MIQNCPKCNKEVEGKIIAGKLGEKFICECGASWYFDPIPRVGGEDRTGLPLEDI